MSGFIVKRAQNGGEARRFFTYHEHDADVTNMMISRPAYKKWGFRPDTEADLMAFYYETGGYKYLGAIHPNSKNTVKYRFEISSWFRGSAPNMYQISVSPDR